MPSVSVEGEVSELAADPETLDLLEQCVINWLDQISAAIEGQLRKTPQVARPAPPKGRCSSRPLPRAVGRASFLTVL